MAINRLKDQPTWLKVATTLDKLPILTHLSTQRVSNAERLLKQFRCYEHLFYDDIEREMLSVCSRLGVKRDLPR